MGEYLHHFSQESGQASIGNAKPQTPNPQTSTASTDSDILSSDDERIVSKTRQEGDDDVRLPKLERLLGKSFPTLKFLNPKPCLQMDGVSLGSFEETDEAVVHGGEGVDERG